MNEKSGALRVGHWCLVIVSVGVLVFGVVEVIAPSGADRLIYRSVGLASLGLGLFGGMLAHVPFRRRERWAWAALWFYPVFWVAHLAGGLPPGKDHVHQIVFVVLSLSGLLIPAREFFPPRAG